jgi:hypothetical protein
MKKGKMSKEESLELLERIALTLIVGDNNLNELKAKVESIRQELKFKMEELGIEQVYCNLGSVSIQTRKEYDYGEEYVRKEIELDGIKKLAIKLGTARVVSESSFVKINRKKTK